MGSTLSLEGALYDRIVYVSKLRTNYVAPFFEIYHLMPDKYPYTTQYSTESIWRTYIKELTWDAATKSRLCPAPDSFAENFRAWLLVCRQSSPQLWSALKILCMLDDSNGLPSTPELEQYETNHDLSSIVVRKSDICETALKDARSRHQKLFLPENGSLGLGPPLMKKGDEIFLMGARTPFVLRREPRPEN